MVVGHIIMSKLLLGVAALVGLGFFVSRDKGKGALPKEGPIVDPTEPAIPSAPSTEGMPADLAKRVKEAVAAGDPAALAALAAELLQGGFPEAATDLQELAETYVAEAKKLIQLQGVWESVPAQPDGDTAPSLGQLSEATLQALYNLLVETPPAGATTLYLEMMGRLEDEAREEHARWVEWLGQNNGALPNAQTPAQPQSYMQMFTALSTQLQALVTAAVASGDASQIGDVADQVEAAGHTELAAWLRAAAGALPVPKFTQVKFSPGGSTSGGWANPDPDGE